MVEIWSPSLTQDESSNFPVLLRCIAIDNNSHDVKTFCFETIDGRSLSFKPGQYLVLEAPVGAKLLQRAYTIASAPIAGSSLCELTIKRDGQFTQWLFDCFEVGHTIRASLPTGHFTLDLANRDKLLLLSGGVGITPMLSFSRHIANQNLSLDVVFIHSARSAQECLFSDELKDIEVNQPNFRYLQTLDSGCDNSHLNGLITPLWLAQNVPDIVGRAVFCCGPQGYMDKMRAITELLKVPPNHFHWESFGSQPQANSNMANSASQPPVQTYQIQLSRSKHQFEITSQQSIMQAFEAQQLPISGMCRNGGCRGCARQLISGEIEEIYPQALSDEEKEMGFILTCACRATSDLVIAD